MITENIPAPPTDRHEPPPAAAPPSFLKARSLVAPALPATWMDRWQSDNEAWKAAVKSASSS